MSQSDHDADNLTPLQRALFAVKDMRSRLEAVERARTEPIAVIGIGCRFPGGVVDLDSYWRLLKEGTDAITEVPSERWDVDAYYDPDPSVPGKMSTRWGGFLNDVDRFDAAFFGIAPREAASMDPQQRLFLEVVWEALENAGIAPGSLNGSLTGVFAGISTSDYFQLRAGAGDVAQIDAYSATGGAFSVAAGRVSYALGFHGPNFPVDTACSSSLVAVHLASQSLRNGECNLALAGGVNLVLSPSGTIYFSKLRAMARDGRCKTFDAAADGYVRADGCGFVVLERLSDAVARGDEILALVLGSAVNHDGRSGGLTAPSRFAQQSVLRSALAAAGVKPAQVSYVEAHGTGTPLGDPIELAALANVMGEGRDPGRRLLVGSVKTNIGHTESAAGIAGLIKTVLALRNDEIPAHLHFRQPNPYVPWKEIPITIPSRPVPWPVTEGERRIAGVSSFGFSGTNAHVVLAEAPPVSESVATAPDRPFHILPLSARTQTALSELAERYERHVAERAPRSVADLCHTAAVGRSHFGHRAAIVIASRNPEGLRSGLAACAQDVDAAGVYRSREERSGAPRIGFLFTGQGSQYTGMGRELYETQPVFRRAMNQCDELLKGRLQESLISVLYAQPERAARIDETGFAQPVLFALEYSLAEMWRSWGVVPGIVLGHSVGEYVAACVAGMFTLEEGLELIAERGRMMQSLPKDGAMAAVVIGERGAAEAIEGAKERVTIAAVNGPESTVLSGEVGALEGVLEKLKERGISWQRLTVSHAFHSALMEPILDTLEAAARRVAHNMGRVPLVSNVTGEVLRLERGEMAGYWRRHARMPVRFEESIRTARKLGCEVMIELGPAPVLSVLGQRCLAGDKDVVWLGTLRRGRRDWQTVLESVARLYVEGGEIDWVGFDREYRRRKTPVPTYPFQRQRYWLEAAVKPAIAAKGPETSKNNYDDCLYEVKWEESAAQPAGEQAGEPGTWVVFADADEHNRTVPERTARAVAGLLEERRNRVISVAAGDGYAKEQGLWRINAEEPEQFDRLMRDAREAGELPCRGVIFLWGIGERSGKLEDIVSGSYGACAAVLHLVQALARSEGAGSPRLWLVTRGVHVVAAGADTATGLDRALLWGFGRGVALEHPSFWGGMIDLETNASDADAAAILGETGGAGRENESAYRNGRRHVPRLVACEAASTKPLRFKDEATYLITGGLGALGLQVASWMVRLGGRHILLAGRHSPSEEVEAALRKLEETGARVKAVRADISDAEDVRALLRTIVPEFPQLRGIVHAAGVLEDGVILRQSRERLTRVLDPKVHGAWNLHTLSPPLDFLVLFSSAAALFGSPGQVGYAAANAFLDALAWHRRAQGLPAVSLNWGPWANVGMSAARRSIPGTSAISLEQGFAALEAALCQGIPQVAVLPFQWSVFARQFPAGAVPPLLDKISHTETLPVSEAASEPNLLDNLLRANVTERPGIVTSYLQRRLHRIAGMELGEIPLTRDLMELGVDSLMAMELIQGIRQDLSLALYPREFYEHPSISALALYLAAEVERLRPQPVAGGRTVDDNAPAAELRKPAKMERRFTVTQRIPGVVLLLSSPRSGSTLLRVMLAGHSELFCPPELHLLPFETMRERQESLGSSYLDEGLQRAFMEAGKLDAAGSRALMKDLVERDVPVAEVYRMLKGMVGERLLVDKSPTYAGDMEALQHAEALFERARYIHLVRHPGAMIESFVRNRMDRLVGETSGDPQALAARIWATSNGNLLEFLTHVDPARHERIQFETLVREPESVMRLLCEFLSVPFEDAVLRPYEGHRMTDGVHTQSIAIGDPNFLNHDRIESSKADAWRGQSLAPQIVDSLEPAARLLGYQIDDGKLGAIPAGPSPALREFYLDAHGRRLCLCNWGPEEGPLVVCFHGMLDHGAAWEEVALRLVKDGFRVIAPDLRGHGLSDHARGAYHLLDFVADADAIAGTLPSGPFTLVGHSLGAGVAALYAATRPERIASLVLVEPPALSRTQDGMPLDRLIAQLDHLAAPAEHPVFPDLATVVDRLRRSIPSLSRELAGRAARRLTQSCEGGLTWRWDARLRARAIAGLEMLTADLYPQIFERLGSNVTLTYGTAGVLSDGRGELPKIPGSRHLMLPGGHNLHLDAPDVLARVISEAARGSSLAMSSEVSSLSVGVPNPER